MITAPEKSHSVDLWTQYWKLMAPLSTPSCYFTRLCKRSLGFVWMLNTHNYRHSSARSTYRTHSRLSGVTVNRWETYGWWRASLKWINYWLINESPGNNCNSRTRLHTEMRAMVGKAISLDVAYYFVSLRWTCTWWWFDKMTIISRWLFLLYSSCHVVTRLSGCCSIAFAGMKGKNNVRLILCWFSTFFPPVQQRR